MKLNILSVNVEVVYVKLEGLGGEKGGGGEQRGRERETDRQTERQR